MLKKVKPSQNLLAFLKNSMNSLYNIFDKNSIINFAKKLKNQTLRQACGETIEKHGYKGKGNFGQILEKFYFGYEPNSDSEPDFKEAGVELKSSPLKTLRNGEFRSKERLVLNIINYGLIFMHHTGPMVMLG